MGRLDLTLSLQQRQQQIQNASGPSFTRLGGSDHVKVSLLYVGVATGLFLALRGQTNLWMGTGKVDRN